MKTVLALLTVGVMQPCVGSPFVNLTFDEPDLTGSLTPIYPGGPLEGDAARILNGWSLVVNGGMQTMMAYSPHGTSTAGLATLDENSPAEKLTILGSYSLSLESSFPSQPDIRIRQTGTIPLDAVGLWIGSAGRIEGFINGQKIGEIDPFLGSHAFLDVTRFAGQEVSLEFALPPGGSARFDIFGFTQVPEPSTWALFGVGAAAVFYFARRKS